MGREEEKVFSSSWRGRTEEVRTTQVLPEEEEESF